VKQNEQHVYEGSRWVLYHGTSTARLKRILEDGRLRTSGTDNPKISLTTERPVAEYWACHAVFGDRRDRPGEDSSEVVLVIDGEGLLELNYDLSAFSDPISGEGECDWENEIACWDKPTTPPMAGFELAVMAEMIDKLVDDEITPAGCRCYRRRAGPYASGVATQRGRLAAVFVMTRRFHNRAGLQ
jgi:hypothetical protein